MPTRTDISVWRGNNAPAISWTLPDPMPDGAAYFLVAAAGGRRILARDTPSGTLVLDAEARELRWNPSISETRAIPAGRVANYEIEQRVGETETTLICGAITGLGGLNTDAGAPDGATLLDASDPENIPLFLLGWLA